MNVYLLLYHNTNIRSRSLHRISSDFIGYKPLIRKASLIQLSDFSTTQYIFIPELYLHRQLIAYKLHNITRGCESQFMLSICVGCINMFWGGGKGRRSLYFLHLIVLLISLCTTSSIHIRLILTSTAWLLLAIGSFPPHTLTEVSPIRSIEKIDSDPKIPISWGY